MACFVFRAIIARGYFVIPEKRLETYSLPHNECFRTVHPHIYIHTVINIARGIPSSGDGESGYQV